MCSIVHSNYISHRTLGLPLDLMKSIVLGWKLTYFQQSSVWRIFILYYDWELLSVKYCVEYYKQYLLGWHFRVHSDHEAPKWLYSLKETKHRIVRWIKALSEFDFEVEYWPGKKHDYADALSRCPNPRDCSCPPGEEKELPCKSCKKCLEWARVYMGWNPRNPH